MMNISVNIVYLISVLIHPFTPAVSKDILNQLKVINISIFIIYSDAYTCSYVA